MYNDEKVRKQKAMKLSRLNVILSLIIKSIVSSVTNGFDVAIKLQISIIGGAGNNAVYVDEGLMCLAKVRQTYILLT